MLDLRLAKLPAAAIALAIDLAVQVRPAASSATCVLAAPRPSSTPRWRRPSALVFYVAGDRRLPGRVRDAHPRPDARARWRWGCASCATTAARSGSGTPWCAACSGSSRSGSPAVAVALITSLASSAGKRVGDYLAGTVVVRERVPRRRGADRARCRRRWPAGRAGWTCRGCPTTWRWPPGSSSAAPASSSPQVRDAMGARWPARWPRHRTATARRAYRPGRSCRPCWPSGGAARLRLGWHAPRTYAAAGPPATGAPPPPRRHAAVRHRRSSRPGASGPATGRSPRRG